MLLVQNLPFLERMTVLETELNSLLNTVNNADHEQVKNAVDVDVDVGVTAVVTVYNMEKFRAAAY